jgi:hypothetical protein
MSAVLDPGNPMDEPSVIECPFCGEPGEIEADLDETEPGTHVFVQDCAVCCHPWTVRITVEVDGEVTVSVNRE